MWRPSHFQPLKSKQVVIVITKCHFSRCLSVTPRRCCQVHGPCGDRRTPSGTSTGSVRSRTDTLKVNCRASFPDVKKSLEIDDVGKDLDVDNPRGLVPGGSGPLGSREWLRLDSGQGHQPCRSLSFPKDDLGYRAWPALFECQCRC